MIEASDQDNNAPRAVAGPEIQNRQMEIKKMGDVKMMDSSGAKVSADYLQDSDMKGTVALSKQKISESVDGVGRKVSGTETALGKKSSLGSSAASAK